MEGGLGSKETRMVGICEVEGVLDETTISDKGTEKWERSWGSGGGVIERVSG